MIKEPVELSMKSVSVSTCPYCGKVYSKQGIKGHIRYCSETQKQVETQPVSDRLKQDSNETQKKYTEGTMQEEYTEKKAEIEPKKPEVSSDTYTCGACQAKMSGKHQHCPECGSGLEWN